MPVKNHKPGGGAPPHASFTTQPKIRLNILLMFIGSRGDLQPSIAIAKVLQHQHGHRVRIASHPPFRTAVEAAGIEFYSIGEKTDTRVMQQRRLLSMNELQTLKPIIREEFHEMGERWWQACIDGPDGLPEGTHQGAFVADAIISTMQVFIQTSAAARMGVPLHIFGMNPRTSSKYLPHSQAGAFAKGDNKVLNLFSWWLQEFVFFHAMKPVINNIRANVIGLEPMAPTWQLSQFNRMCVPHTYLWSPAFLAKPPDWGENISIAGYVFDEAPDYDPPPDLVAFLEAKATPPIYIGFGSMSFPEPEKIFKEVFVAVKQAGTRAVICRGWSNLPDNIGQDVPDIFLIDELPHAWLFPRISAVVCHGGGGTTAMALRSGKPTLIVPVAGDQPFWGNRVFKTGCGPEPTFNIQELTAERLVEKLRDLLRPSYATAAAELATQIRAEAPGEKVFAEDALQTFSVYEEEGRCDVFVERPAVWKTTNGAKLSAVVAYILIEAGRIKQADLSPLNLVKWPDLVAPGDPLHGLVQGILKVSSYLSCDIKRVSSGSAGQGLAFLLLHFLRAPLIVLGAVIFGVYNLLDFVLYELASPFTPKLFVSNPRLYTYIQMLLLLLSTPIIELSSIFTQATALARQGRIPRAIAEVPLALLRVLLALVAVIVGFLALTLRAADISCATLMNERLKGDVVAAARIRQGRIQAQDLDIEAVEQGAVGMRETIIRRWDEIFGSGSTEV